ncbi:MAG: hypothetical protein ACLRFE_02465 [Clostridia bacterium]
MLKFKSKTYLTLLVLFAITLFIVSPSLCMDATTKGIKVWLINVVPALFPFFILTRIIITLNQTSMPTLDKFTTKLFNTNNSGLIYCLSLLSGYPIGAKLISSYYQSGAIDKSTATKMFSFCSTSGPMFIIGAVGIGIFKNVKAGYILLIGHIIGSLSNGLLYRGKPIQNIYTEPRTSKSTLNDIMFDSINSILLVGGYIVFASVVIELLKISNILPGVVNIIGSIVPVSQDVIYGFLCGVIEITNGLILLNQTTLGLTLKIILSSFIISFSGICIMMQSTAFLNQIGIKKSTLFAQKLTQAILTTLITALITCIFC